MSITSYSQDPYHDDYLSGTPTPKDKNYLKILFKPGVSVQARELNQIQSILQNQIDTHGNHIFKRNTPVLGGATQIDNNVYFIDVDVNDQLTSFYDTLESLKGVLVSNEAKITISNSPSPNDVLSAEIVNVEETNTIGRYRIYLRYTSTVIDNTDTVISEFSVDPNQDLELSNIIYGENSVEIDELGTVQDKGYASRIFVDSGTFYINGCFVITDEISEYIVRTDKDQLLNGRIVFEVVENVITALTDDTLLDNATGTPNFTSPGADRYQIDLNLYFFDTAGDLPIASNVITEVGENQQLVDLVTVENSVIVIPAHTEYAELQNRLALRTKEESGNYTVNPFVIELREFLNEDGNRGRYTTAQLLDLDESSTPNEEDARGRYYIGLEPSVAYVDGYRIQTTGKKELYSDKARATATDTVYTTARLGQYIETEIGNGPGAVSGMPVINGGTTYTFSGGGGTTTCKIRGFEYTGSKYRLYLYDISGAVPDTGNLSGGTFTFTADSDGFFLSDTSHNTTAWKLPYEAIKTVDGIKELTVIKRVTRSGTVSGGSIAISAGSNEVFPYQQGSDYIVVYDSDDSIEIPTGVTQNSPNNVTLSGLPDGNVEVLCSIQTNQLSTGFATEASNTESGLSPDANNIYDLSKQRVIEITSVSTGNLSDFKLIRDDKSGSIGNAKVEYIGGGSAPDPLTIGYNYLNGGIAAVANSYSTIDQEDIPSYNGTRLSDYLDFRTTNDSSATLVLDPNSIITAEVEFYLPRIDKVFVDSVGNFEVIEGTPSLNPEIPETPGNSMALYNLFVPAYTYNVSDIQPMYIDNRRYTMRDIGALEKRISTLEYYTSLSLLEREATNRQIINPADNTDRFKNGIIVDSFRGHDVGDAEDPGYVISIEPQQGILRPLWEGDNIPLKIVGTNNDDTLTLDYTEEVLLEQKYASIDISVNPYELANWNGTIELSPSSDEWIETEIRPDVIINQDNNADATLKVLQESNALATTWGAWNTIAGSGEVIGTKTVRSGFVRNWRQLGWEGGRRIRVINTVNVDQIREGIRTTASIETIQKSLGERIVDQNIIPFIRSRKISFKGELFKPNTKLYAFFDDIDVTDFCETTTNFEKWKDDASTPVSYLGDDAVAVGFNGQITTDVNGVVNGKFVIPNNDDLKFRTGQRQFRLTDSKENNRTNETTTGVATYTASGLLNVKEEVILSTREVVFDETRVTSTRNVNVKEVVSTTYYDPLAQSFLIGNIESGCYVTSTDLYFRKRSVNVPVSMHLVTVENGIPTQKIVPFSKVVLNPGGVYISENATAETNFKFSAPVYLAPGVEYAIVVLSNDPEYRLWMAETGGFDATTGDKISKNPFAGVSFKSQNASTWTPDQNKDFKFKMYRAKYDIESPKTATFNLSTTTPVDASLTQLRTQEIVLPGTSISYTLNSGSDNYPLLSNIDIGYNASETFAFNSTLTVQLTSDNDYVSPSLDLDRISMLFIRNIVSTEAGIGNEELATHGNATARYITREVELNNPADQLNLYLLANRVSQQCNLKVYIRTKTGDESIKDVDWIEITPIEPLPVNSDGTYTELSFEENYTNLFSGFQVKIVFHSEDTGVVATVKDFRAIATT
jgi:hypothetical protein